MRPGAESATPTPARARRALALAAALALAGLAATAIADPPLRLRLAPALLLLGAPLLRERLARRRAAARTHALLLAAFFAQLTGIALLQATAASWWAAGMLQAQARARSGAAAALSGVLALGTTVVALREQPSAFTFLLPFVACTLVLPALSSLAGHGARARLRRARVPLAAATHEPAPVPAPMAVLAWPVVLAALLASATCTSGPRADEGSAGAPEETPRRADEGVFGIAVEPTPWAEHISYGEGVGRLSDEAVLWVRPSTGNSGPLYLSVLALDHVDERGLSQPGLNRLREISDGDDGFVDGWIDLAEDAHADALELRVRQRSQRLGRLGGEALVRIEPLLGLDFERVLYEPDTALVLPEAGEGYQEYTLRCIDPDRRARVPEQARARHVDPRYTQLPENAPEMEWVREIAAEWLADAPGDLAAVERLMQRFERDFDYDLEGSFVGVRGALDFLLEERAGYCTTFASTAVLLLRSRGIACRAIGGYLADEWDAQRGVLAARGTDAHAWIEVHFEGLGWRTFDPTPSAERERAFQRREGVLAPEVSEWSGALWSSLVESVGGASSGAGLARLGANLAQAPAVLRQELLEEPPAVRVGLLCVLALGVVGAWLLQRVERRRGLAAGTGSVLPWRRGPYEHLLAQLAQRGLRAAGHESLRAFAQRVESARVLPGFARATEAHLAERFGGQALDAPARAHLEALRSSLRRDPLARA